MEIQVLLRVIAQRWRIVAIVTLLAIVASLAWSLAGPVTYKAEGRVMISTSGSMGTAADAYSSEQVSIARAPTYADLLGGPEVAARASKKLNGDISAQTIQDSVDARISSRLPMVIVTATSSSANDAVQIVAAAEQGLQEYVKEFERPGRDGSLTAVVLSGDAPVVSRNNKPVLYAVLAGLAGLILGCVLAVYRDRTDPLLKGPGQISGEGIAYLGTIDAEGEQSAIDAAFRRVAVGLVVTADSDPARLLVTGVDQDGATRFVGRGVAGGMAVCGRAVTLIDSIGESSGGRKQTGLSDVLASAEDWREHATPTRTPNLLEMGMGTSGRSLDALVIENTDLKSKLSVSGRDEQIVIAAPSIVHSSTAVALTALVDAALLVVRSGVSPVADLLEAKLTLEGMGVPVVGLVFVEGTPAASPARSRAKASEDDATTVIPAQRPVAMGDENGGTSPRRASSATRR